MRMVKTITAAVLTVLLLLSCTGSDITQKVKTYFVRQRSYEVGFIIGKTRGVAGMTYDGNDSLEVSIGEGTLSGYRIQIDSSGTTVRYGEYVSDRLAGELSVFSYVRDIFNALSHNDYRVDTKEKSTIDNRPCYYEEVGADFGSIRLCVDSASFRPIKIETRIDDTDIELNIFGR